MSTTLSTPTMDLPQVERLRSDFIAMRLSFSWLGVRKCLTVDQRTQAASQFDAEQKFISATKKLLDTSHPAMRAVNQLKSQMTAAWKGSSLPYPESGIRLVRRDDIELLNDRMLLLTDELAAATESLEAQYAEIKELAQDRLGHLFCDADYPASLENQFQVTWDFPSVEPPDYLRRLQPELYEQECARVRQRFEAAVELAEQAFLDELSSLVSHLTERLAGSTDGRPKVFRDSAVENLTEFFDRFQRLSVASLPELDELVARAQRVVTGVSPGALRQDGQVRQQVASQLAGVQSVLDGLMVDRPRRKLIRS